MGLDPSTGRTLARSANRARRGRPLAHRRRPPRHRGSGAPTMSSASRVAGLLRSLAIYHGIPLRQRRLRRFYAQFVSPGDLVFDLGAHAGNRTRAFAAMGCRIVAVEPQPDFARLLRLLFARSPLVDVDRSGSRQRARAHAAVHQRAHPTVTTIAAPWHEARALEPDFAGVRWDRRIDVETTTMDLLIERFGMPAFVKIDVEGSEPAVLAGLSRPVRSLSFEYLPRALDYAQVCAARLSALGPYRFNWSAGESYRLATDQWMTEAGVVRGAPRRRTHSVARATSMPGSTPHGSARIEMMRSSRCRAGPALLRSPHHRIRLVRTAGQRRRHPPRGVGSGYDAAAGRHFATWRTVSPSSYESCRHSFDASHVVDLGCGVGASLCYLAEAAAAVRDRDHAESGSGAPRGAPHPRRGIVGSHPVRRRRLLRSAG